VSVGINGVVSESASMCCVVKSVWFVRVEIVTGMLQSPSVLPLMGVTSRS
jgi:hypothetical protein